MIVSFAELNFRQFIASGRLKFHPYLYRLFHQSKHQKSPEAKLSSHDLVRTSFKILEVDVNCSEEELRAAYLLKVKAYHPDHNTPTSNVDKFVSVQNAYKTALEYKRDPQQQQLDDTNKTQQFDEEELSTHIVPQHRQYLTLEGVGYGTPSRREKQYKQFRVAKATENIYEYRKLQFGSNESAVVTKDKAEARKIKTSNLIDRVVDDLIREAMQKGEFRNLPGEGKPLDYSSHNPMVDATTHNLNKIMVNNGLKPEWIMLSKEIRENIGTAKQNLAIFREVFGTPPYDTEVEIRFGKEKEKLYTVVDLVNSKITRFNLLVPFMEKQMVHYQADKLIKYVLNSHEQLLPRDENGNIVQFSQEYFIPIDRKDVVTVKWRDVWSNIVDSFRTART